MEVRAVMEKTGHGNKLEEVKNYRNIAYDGRIAQENGLDIRRIDDDDEKDKKKEKKWTLGGFFRRKGKKEADDSSEEEEDGKKGFLSRRRSGRSKRKSNANGFDIVVSPHALETVGKTAEELWAAPQEPQQRFIFRHQDVRAESNLSRNSGGGSGSLDGRKGRREVMARAQAKRDKMCDGSSSDDNESGASNSSLSKDGRRRRVVRPKIPSATPSPTRSPRVQPKHPLHASSSYPLPVHTYPPGYHWDVGAFNQHIRTPHDYEQFLSTCGTRNKSLSCEQDMHRAEAMFVQLPIARTRSSCIRVETHGEVPNLKPEPPPRSHPVASRFDSTSSLPIQPQSLIKRSSSGNSFMNYYENLQDPSHPRASSYQHIYQNYRVPNGVSKATTQLCHPGLNTGYYRGTNGNGQKVAMPLQNELRYYADQNPRSRNPIHITCGSTNPSPTGDPSCLSDSQISRRSTKEFWRQKDKELMLQQLSQQNINGPQTKEKRSRSNSPMNSGVTHYPVPRQTAVVVTRKVIHAVPGPVESVRLHPPGHSDEMRVKTPPEPPLRRRSNIENSVSPPACEITEKSTSNLDDALNELETIYKSLRLSDEHTTPSKKKPSPEKSPDIIADDMAKRRLNVKEPFDQNRMQVRQSYLQCSPAFNGTPGHSPIPVKPASPAVPDITFDDVVFRNIRHANSKHKTPDPQPPFGIPIGPVTPAPQSDYLHINPAEKFRSSFVASKIPDVMKDDLAFRNLRKDGLTTNTPIVNFNGKTCPKKRAVRSLSENLFNLLQKDNNGFLPIETNNNIIDNDFDKTQSMTDLNENIQRDSDILEQRLKALKEEKLNKRTEFFEEKLKPALSTGLELRRSCSNTDSRQKSTSTETLTEDTELRKTREILNHKRVCGHINPDSQLQPPLAPERRHFRSPVVELSKYPAAVPATALFSNPFKEEPTPMEDSQLDDLLSTMAREAKITSEAIGKQLVELDVAAASDMLSPDKRSKSKLSKLSAELASSVVKNDNCAAVKEETRAIIKTAQQLKSPTTDLKVEPAVYRKSKTVSPLNESPSTEKGTTIRDDIASLVQTFEFTKKCKDSSASPKSSIVSNLSQILLEVEKEHAELSKKIGGETNSFAGVQDVALATSTVSQSHSNVTEIRKTDRDHIGATKNDVLHSQREVDSRQLLNPIAYGLTRASDPRVDDIEVKKIHHTELENRNHQADMEDKKDRLILENSSTMVRSVAHELSNFSSDVTVVETKMEEVPSTATLVTILSPSSPNDEVAGDFEPISDFSEIMDSEEQEECQSVNSGKVDIFEKVYEYNCAHRNVPVVPKHEETEDVRMNEEVKRILSSRTREDQDRADGRRRNRRDDSRLPRGTPRGQGDDSGSDMSGVRRNGESSSSNGPSPNTSEAERARERMERYKEKRRQELSAKYGPRTSSSSSDSRQGREKTETPTGVSKKTETKGRESADRELWGVRETKASRLRAASQNTVGKPEIEKTMPAQCRKEATDKSAVRKSLLNRQMPSPESTSQGVSSVRRKSSSHSASASPTINGHTATRDQAPANNTIRLQRSAINNIAKRPDERNPSPRAKKPPDATPEERAPPLRLIKSSYSPVGGLELSRTKKNPVSLLEDRAPTPRSKKLSDASPVELENSVRAKKPVESEDRMSINHKSTCSTSDDQATPRHQKASEALFEERIPTPRFRQLSDSTVGLGPSYHSAAGGVRIPNASKLSGDIPNNGPPMRLKKSPDDLLEESHSTARHNQFSESSVGVVPSHRTVENLVPGSSTSKFPEPKPLDSGSSLRFKKTEDVSLENRVSIPRSWKIMDASNAECVEPSLVKPSILKKKSVEEVPMVNGVSPRPVSILKRKTLSQDGAVTFSPSVVEKEQSRKKQGILKKRRSLDESEVARRRSSSPDKSILKNIRRSSMEELTSILKRDSSENVAVCEQPQGILKRKSSTPTPAVQQHVTIAESVIMAAAAALNDFVPIDGVRPILKKKSSSEEHTPELPANDVPRPILKKKSVEVEDMPCVKPILKSSRKNSVEELSVQPILKRTEGGDADEGARRLRSLDFDRERARSAPPSRPTSLAGSGFDDFLMMQSQRSPTPTQNPESAEDFSPPSQSSGEAEVFAKPAAHVGEQEEAASLENIVPSPQEMEKSNEARSSAMSRFRDRKLRDSARFHTQPISAEVLEAAAHKNSPGSSSSGKEDETEDDLSRLSLSERVRLFNTRIQEAGATPPTPGARRSRTSRFKTQPVTDEERTLAQTLRSATPPPDPEAMSTPTVPAPPLSVRRGILKQASVEPSADSNGVAPALKLKLPTGRQSTNGGAFIRGSEAPPNLAKLLQTVSQEAVAHLQAKSNSSIVKSQSHSAVSSVLRKTYTQTEGDPPDEEKEGVVRGGLRRSTTQTIRHQDNDDEDLTGLSIKERAAKLRKSGEVGWEKRKMRMKAQDEVAVITTGNYLCNGSASAILSSRLDQLDTARESWRTRVPQTDAVQFTVEGKMGCWSSKYAVPPTATSNSEKTKKSPKQVRFRSRNFAPLLQSTPASPQPAPTLTRSMSAPSADDPPSDLSPPAMLGPAVPIPRADDETFTSFFQSLAPIPDNERLELKDDDLDALQRTDTKLLVHKRTVKVQRRTRRGVRNPVKSLALRSDLQEEYVEFKTGVAERELRRMKVEKLSRGTSLAVEALAGLASTEDFTAIALRKPMMAPVQYPDTMLLKIKGRRHVQTRLVEPCPASVNKGDCFLLVTRNMAAMYHGELSNVVERARAKDVAARIEAGDLACGAGRVSNEGRFWAELGGEPAEAGSPDEDERMEVAMNATNMIYELVDHELVPVSSAWGAAPKVDILDPMKNLVFDFGSEMYVWSGRSAALSGRREASNLARELWEEGYDYSECETSPLGPMQGSERPPWTLFCKVTQNMEPILFKEKFQDWPDEAMLNRQLGFSEVDGSTLMEIQPCDASRMVKEHPPWPDLELEGTHLGRGVSWFDSDTRRWSEVSTVKVSVWRVTDSEHSEIEDESSLAQFYDNGSYVIRWHYSVSVNVRGLNGEPSKHVTSPGRDRFCYFLWQGRFSSPADRGAAAVLTVSLDAENAPQLVVPQLAEPPAFLQLFSGVMTVHRSAEPAPSSLYFVRGVEPGEVLLLQVEVTMKSLRSRGCLLIIDRVTPALTLWCGCQASKSYRNMAQESVQKILKLRPPEYRLPDISTFTTEEEGSESPHTLAALVGSRSDYLSLLESPDTPERTIRLFHFASTSGEFSVTELSSPLLHPDLTCPYPFLQSDLYSVSQPAVFVLDAGDELWVWQGWTEEDSAPSAVVRYQAEKRATLQTVLEYWERTRKLDAPTKGSLVWAGLEPAAFTCLFPFWEVREDVQERNMKETQRSVGEVVDLETELKRLTCNRYPLQVLLERPLPDGVDPTNLELYLEPKAFPDVFDMTKEEFMELPSWKKTSLKKEAGLF